jgi:hypothetical protein
MSDASQKRSSSRHGVSATSKRTKARKGTHVVPEPDAPAEPLATPGPDKLRRLLLAGVVTVVVARPLVGGEHPGYLSDFADPGSMALTFLTLFAVAAWAGWRLIMRQPALYLGWADLAVFAVGLFAFLGATHAGYRRPAWLAGWDWLGTALLYLLVRQLAVRPEERHGWVAVLLAGAVAVSAEGLYQSVYVLPAQAAAEQKYREDRLTDDPTAYLNTEYLVRGMRVTPLELHQLIDRLENRRAHGPFFHPASLAAVLALAMPLAAGALLASVRGQSPAWQSGLAAVCLLAIGAAQVLTREWSAVAMVGLAAVGLACCLYMKRPAGLIAALVVVAAGVGGVFALGLLPRAEEVWPGAWQLLQAHFWLGVGPAQFAQIYPRYMAETAGIKAVEPGGALLDVLADAGAFGGAALVVAVGLILRAVWQWRAEDVSPSVKAPRSAGGVTSPARPDDDAVNWEFYLGGMLGLVIAFLLRAAAVPPEDVLGEAVVAGLRAVAWFAAFALYEGIGWTVEEHLGALLTGAAAMFLCLLVGPGLGYPSVATSLWVAVALVLATVSPRPAEWLSRQVAVGLITAPAFVALAFGYFAFFFYPASASAAALRRAQLAGLTFRVEMNKSANERSFRDPTEYVRRRLIEPVEKALKEDADNVRLMTHLADWYGQLWQLAPGERRLWETALAWATLARQADPLGFDGHRIEDDLRRRFAALLLSRAEALEKELEKEKADQKKPVAPEAERKKMALSLRQEARQQHDFAAQQLKKYAPHDPTDPQLRYAIAAALFAAGKATEGREFAGQARDLDETVKAPRKLTDPQRKQVDKWLNPESRS